MLYSDAHLHVNPVKGLGAEKVAKKFKSLGGWFISIVSLPPYHYGYVEPSITSYSKVLEILVREASRAREQKLKVAVFMGFHPAEIDNYYKQGVKAEKLVKLVDEVVKVIEDALKTGLIDGIGEVGRQHYGTSAERLILAEAVMVRALALARDYGVPVQLHTEQAGLATVYSVKTLVDQLKTPANRVILHHVGLETALWAERLAVPFTAPIRSFDEKYASYKWTLCMIESDFIDDPNRPGVSAYPWEIPEKLDRLLESGVISEEQLYRIMVDNIAKFFEVSPP